MVPRGGGRSCAASGLRDVIKYALRSRRPRCNRRFPGQIRVVCRRDWGRSEAVPFLKITEMGLFGARRGPTVSGDEKNKTDNYNINFRSVEAASAKKPRRQSPIGMVDFQTSKYFLLLKN